MDKWKTLRIKVTAEKKNAEAELLRLSEGPTEWDSINEFRMRMRFLDNVLALMDQLETVDDGMGTEGETLKEALARRQAWERSREFSGPGIGEWDDLSEW